MTACERILDLLRTAPRTSAELMDVGGMGMRQRISDLRKQGYIIVCRRHPSKPKVNVYSLIRGPR